MSNPNNNNQPESSSQPNFDFGTLSHSTLPDLSLINQPKLTLDLGSTDLSVSLDELDKTQELNRREPNQPSLASHQAQDQAIPSDLARNHSRRWTSLSELGRAVLKPSVSNLRQLGSLNERSATQQRTAAGHLSRRLSEASGTPSIYSSYRHNRNIFKLWSHQPVIESSPPSSSSAAKFPSLPPMSELLDGSASFNQQELCSITQPISLAHLLDPLSDSTPAHQPLPPSPPQSPSPSSNSEPTSELHFTSAVQSPTVLDSNHLTSTRALVDSPSPRTPSLKFSESSPVVPTIDRVLIQADGDTTGPADQPKEVPPVSPKDGPEDPTIAKSPVSPVLESKTGSHPTTTMTTNQSHPVKTNLAGILSRKKKTPPTAGSGTDSPASTGTGSTSFFKLFLLKSLGFKHHHSHPLVTTAPSASGRPSTSSTAPSPAVA